jgi:DDE superfamily endonuclease
MSIATREVLMILGKIEQFYRSEIPSVQSLGGNLHQAFKLDFVHFWSLKRKRRTRKLLTVSAQKRRRRLRMPCEFIALMVACAPLFSKLPHGQVLLVGALLSPGKRTVTQALRIMGKRQDPHVQNYHRVLNRAVWSSLAAGQIWLGLWISPFALRGTLVLGLDDTRERRRGDKIAAKGIYRDPVRSSPTHVVKASGLRWLALRL